MSKGSKYKFIISGGGTGGHIFPALAIANEIKSRYKSAEMLFVGAKGRMEMEKIPAAGYKIEGLWISGIDRKLSLRNLSFPFKLMSSLIKAKRIIKKTKQQAKKNGKKLVSSSQDISKFFNKKKSPKKSKEKK
ncbi:MAG: glycosyltransferase, partial [Flavobacteriaceae bacterium]|nr:glycosyltransferase [Flavobacteriaceae bacterium]